jgi:type VII secretion protein EccE
VWEVAAVAVAGALGRPAGVAVPLVAVAVVLLALTTLRRRGRWLYEWAGLALRWRTRRHAVPGDDADPAGAVLAALPGGAALGSWSLDGEPVAVISTAGGLVALLEPRPAEDADLLAGPAELPPLPDLLPAAESTDHDVAVQVLVHSSPAPAPGAGDSPAALGYRELTGGLLPGRRRTLLALQALRIPGSDDDADLAPALRGAVHRVQRRLRRAGLTGAPLSPEQAAAELLGLAGGGLPGSGGPAVREAWRGWTLAAGTPAAAVSSSYRVVGWPDLAEPAHRDLAGNLLAVPAAAATVGVTARRRGDDEVELAAAVRLTLAPGQALADAEPQLLAAAARAGVELQRMDGEQAAGVAATLPLGGAWR